MQEFISAFDTELNRQQHDAEILAGLKRKELEEVRRRLDSLIDAIADGLRAPGLQARLDQLENRKTELERELAATLPTPPRFHPKLAELYRNKVARLHVALAEIGERDEALAILRSLIDRVVVSEPEGPLLRN